MFQRLVKKDSTDQSVIIRIIDSADGSPETGVEHNTSGIDLWYRRDGGAVVSITEASLASADAAHADGGIEHLGNGYYRLDLPDAAVATGATGVVVAGTVTGMVVLGAYLQLVDFDPNEGVRLGLTALPNAAAGSENGLPTLDGLGRVSADMTAIDGGDDGIANFAAWTETLSVSGELTETSFSAGAVTEIQTGLALQSTLESVLEDTGTTIPSLISDLETKVDIVDANVDSVLDDTGTAGVVVASLAANSVTASALAADAATEIATAVLAATADTGVSVSKALEMLAALCAGKVTASSNGTVTTLTYKKRDGTTTSFTTVVTEADRTRATTGALS